MVFSSSVFMFIFLPLVYLLVYILPSIRVKNAVLLLASLLFYAWGEPVYVFLLIFSTFVNWLLALPAERVRESKAKRRLLLAVTGIFNIGILVFFKYTGMFVSLVAPDAVLPDIVMPIGISFYTFQVMSYVVDVYRGATSVQKNFFKLLLYVSFFPQLIAGPIVKYRDVAAQIDQRTLSLEKLAQGLRRFVFGLAKKLLIANFAGMLCDSVYALSGEELSAAAAWLAAIAYCIQIYFDFSGYSDMAIGLGRMAGFDFKENFLYPYTATSIQDFWRKWHVSLSTWFKEYVYIPLGGNRKGKLRTGLNKIIVFFLTGLWHGASWTFVAWGLVHGIFIMLEAYGIIKPEKFGKRKILSRVYTLFVVCIAFVLFRAETFGKAWEMLCAMFTRFSLTPLMLDALCSVCQPLNILCVVLGIVLSMPLLRPLYTFEQGSSVRAARLSDAGYIITLPLYLLCVVLVVSSTYNPFIYFRF